MKTLCVYCGASIGVSSHYADSTKLLAKALVEHDIGLVYGGGNLGLMGVLADEMLHLGGEVVGVIPKILMEKEIGHVGLTRLHVVDDMHRRKAMMAELSDGFIALPGGIGTLEEFFETLTWAQLRLHNKPIGLLNVGGFYDGLVGFLGHIVNECFLHPSDADLVIEEQCPVKLISKLLTFRSNRQGKLSEPVCAL